MLFVCGIRIGPRLGTLQRFIKPYETLKPGKCRSLTTARKLASTIARSIGEAASHHGAPSTTNASPLQAAKLPAVLQEVADNMIKYPNCVILTKVGSFYELYFEQATEFGGLLNLKVAERKYAGGKVPMAGFPFFQLDRYLKILVQDLNQHVAISEQFEPTVVGRLKSAGLMWERRVARIVTPGTLVDEKFIEPAENNFLLSIHASAENQGDSEDLTVSSGLVIGLAWLDLSTGEFYTQATTVSNLPSDMSRICPREIVLGQSIDEQTRKHLLDLLGRETATITNFTKHVSVSDMSELSSSLQNSASPIPREEFTYQETIASCTILEYVKEQLLDTGMKLQPPVRRVESENMGIDKSTMRGLEILERAQSSNPGGKGSLLHSIRRTVTKSGARLLRERVSSPSTSLEVINHRLDLLESFIAQPLLRQGLIERLERSFDSQRIAQKFALGRGDADDLVSLHRTIVASESIVAMVHDGAQYLQSRLRQAISEQVSKICLEGPLKLAQTIAAAVDEDALLAHHLQEVRENTQVMTKNRDLLTASGNEDDAQLITMRAKSRGLKLAQVTSSEGTMAEVDLEAEHSGTSSTETGSETDVASIEAENKTTETSKESWIMRRTASATLHTLHSQLDELLKQKLDLTRNLQDTSTANSLSLRWTPGLGHHVHVKGARDIRNTQERLTEAKSVGSSKSTRTFYLTQWTGLGKQIDELKRQIKEEEDNVFRTLRNEVIVNLAALRQNAMVLDELDVACSFAVLAIEQKLTRPILNNGRSHQIVDGRHPTVMLGLEEQGRSFVSNDCLVGDEELIWLITGPNMAGKSTFLRQNALISILAQIGCYVPAKHAEIGIVDQIFSRIGSADNLYQDQSTFMIEMLETANILSKATPRSFVIMDEIGRGTTPEDGIAVGYACLHHLYHVNRCRTLFATHFHALCDMTAGWTRLANYCTDVSEDQGQDSFRYIHRLRRGVNRESHALKVMQLAGVPEKAIGVAEEVKASLVRTVEKESVA